MANRALLTFKQSCTNAIAIAIQSLSLTKTYRLSWGVLKFWLRSGAQGACT